MIMGERARGGARPPADANVGAGCDESAEHRAWRLEREERLTGDARASQQARRDAGVTRRAKSATEDGLRRAEVLALLSYGDIIDLPAHVSYTHPHQPAEVRAAQFAPFAALSGYGDEISETARLTRRRPELADDERESIEHALELVARRVDEARDGAGPLPSVDLTAFVPDPRKEGGSCERVRGRAVSVNRRARTLTVDVDGGAGEPDGRGARPPADGAWPGTGTGAKTGLGTGRVAGRVDVPIGDIVRIEVGGAEAVG